MENKSGGGAGLLDLMKGGYGLVLANSSRAIAVITAVVAALVTFTDVALSSFGTQSFSSSLLVMLIASYLIYFSMFETGQAAGCETPESRSANEEYEAARKRISPLHIASLRDFCHRYVSEELAFRRLCFITERGYGAEDYALYKDGKLTDRHAARVFRRASRLRAARLTPATLLSGSNSGVRSELASPRLARFISTLTGLIPTTLGSIFTVSVMLTAKEGLTAEVIIEGILKLSALPMIALKGYRAGFTHSRETLCSWNRLRARLLSAFSDASQTPLTQ